MLYLKAFHLMAMVAWFAGLFYLPRLFVYHAETQDALGLARFQIMERRLYYGIMLPAAVLTTGLGLTMLGLSWEYYAKAGWMHAKLLLAFFLWGYHGLCGYYRKAFLRDTTTHSARFYRIFNEIPTFFLITMVLLAVVKPF